MFSDKTETLYFATPYRSCERGLNEHTNGLFREYFPKTTEFNEFSQSDIDKVLKKLKNRPRKSLGFLTPQEALLLVLSSRNAELYALLEPMGEMRVSHIFHLIIMKLKVLYYPHSLLKYPTKPVINWNEDLVEFVESMIETMYLYEGIGLAANQVGVSKQILTMDPPIEEDQGEFCQTTDETASSPLVFINPKIETQTQEFVFEGEACLSFPSISIDAKRFQQVTISYQNLLGEKHTLKARGLPAVDIQHEMDHLGGQIFLEKSTLPVKEKLVIGKIQKELQTRNMTHFEKKHKLKSWPRDRLTF